MLNANKKMINFYYQRKKAIGKNHLIKKEFQINLKIIKLIWSKFKNITKFKKIVNTN